MSRRMKLPTREMGEVELLVIWQREGRWEPEWEPLQGSVIGDLFSKIDRETLDHALHGWSRPLAHALGLPPDGALRKLPVAAQECQRRRKCPLYGPRECFPRAKNMPWCFEPDGFEDEVFRRTATQAIEQWRQGVYLVVVEEKPNG